MCAALARYLHYLGLFVCTFAGCGACQITRIPHCLTTALPQHISFRALMYFCESQWSSSSAGQPAAVRRVQVTRYKTPPGWSLVSGRLGLGS
eukprot:357014-Chlamydomonas_euryale.AAC.4